VGCGPYVDISTPRLHAHNALLDTNHHIHNFLHSLSPPTVHNANEPLSEGLNHVWTTLQTFLHLSTPHVTSSCWVVFHRSLSREHGITLLCSELRCYNIALVTSILLFCIISPGSNNRTWEWSKLKLSATVKTRCFEMTTRSRFSENFVVHLLEYT
jgi:hypothetical protein